MIEKLKHLWWLRKAEHRRAWRYDKQGATALIFCRNVMQSGDPAHRDANRCALLRALHYSFIDFRRIAKKSERSETAAKAELRRTA